MPSVVDRHSSLPAVDELAEEWTPPSTGIIPASAAFMLSPNRRNPSSYSDEGWAYLSSSTYEIKEKCKTSLPTLSLPKVNARPIFKGFERPDWSKIALHVFACLFSYPMMYVVTLISRDRSLFLVRALVAVGSALVGFCLAFCLVAFAIKYLEAATWATVIHLSHHGGGMKLKDLANNSESPTNFGCAIKLLLARIVHPGTARSSRKAIDKRPWSLFILFFFILMILGPLIPFALGRIMTIQTVEIHQRQTYREVFVTGDLSIDDVSRAADQLNAFSDFVRTWTLVPFSRETATTTQFSYGDDTVYFAQANASQFIQGGTGMGTFDLNGTVAEDAKTSTNQNTVPIAASDSMGSLLRFPQWGIRIHCETLPDPVTYLQPMSNQSFTYLFLQQSVLKSLFSTFSLDLPQDLLTPNLVALAGNDTIPSNIDPNSLAYIIKWYDNGVAHSFHSRTVLDSTNDPSQGWTTVETTLVRLNNSHTPYGNFPIYGVPILDINGVETRIGYDVAVCVERYEPWIVETYNSSVGSPTALGIVEAGGNIISYGSQKREGGEVADPKALNSTSKNPAFYVAHDNSVNQMVKDNGMDNFYVPSPTTVSFTNGAGPQGYTQLSASRVSAVRGVSDAGNVLPFLVGSGTLAAQKFPDQTIAYVQFVPWQLVTLLAGILIIGLVAGMFVPVLPMSVPRRGFGLYSWLTVLKSQELWVDAQDLEKMTDLEDLEKMLGEQNVKFVL